MVAAVAHAEDAEPHLRQLLQARAGAGGAAEMNSETKHQYHRPRQKQRYARQNRGTRMDHVTATQKKNKVVLCTGCRPDNMLKISQPQSNKRLQSTRKENSSEMSQGEVEDKRQNIQGPLSEASFGTYSKGFPQLDTLRPSTPAAYYSPGSASKWDM